MVFIAGRGRTGEGTRSDGAAPFDPMGSGRVMKEWVDVPVAHSADWAELADSALRLRKSTRLS